MVEEDISTAIPSVDEAEIKPIFNPATGELQISGLSGMATVEIYNVSGVKVFNSVLNEGKTNLPTNLSKGVYLLQIMKGSKRVVIKLSK